MSTKKLTVLSTRPSWQRTALLVLLGVVLLGAYPWAFHDVFAAREPGAVDFFVRYEGTRLYLTEGLNPYSDEATQRIHEGIYAHEHTNLRPQHAFFYPMYTVLLIAPYTLLPTYAWVQAAWQVTLQVLLVAGAVLTLRYFNWKPKPWLLAVLVLWSLLLYPSARAILLGQLTVVVFFLTVLVFWLLFRGEPSARRDVLAGACLALSSIKPQMQFLIIPLLVLWALKARRWHFIASAALSMGVLLGVSFLMLPTWFTQWVEQVISYPSFDAVFPPVLHILTHEVFPLGDGVMWALRVLLAGWLLVEWWLLLRDDDNRRLDWTLAFTLVITHLLAPQTGTYQYVVFLFALLPVLQRLNAIHSLVLLGVMAALFASDWWLFSTTVVADAEAHLMAVPLPLITLLLLVLARGAMVRSTGQPATP